MYKMRVCLLLILLVAVSSKPLRKQPEEQLTKPLSVLYPVEEGNAAERFRVRFIASAVFKCLSTRITSYILSMTKL